MCDNVLNETELCNDIFSMSHIQFTDVRDHPLYIRRKLGNREGERVCESEVERESDTAVYRYRFFTLVIL